MTPREEHYSMPAEWEKHERTFISWPVRDSMCYPQEYDAVCRGYEEIIRAIAEFEPVTVITNEDDYDCLSRLFNDENIQLLLIEHDDAWLRDNGPTFLRGNQGTRAGINWQFNAWGEKYSPWNRDNNVAPKILQAFNIRQIDAPLVMEGGSLHVDGEGTLLTTEECLLNPNRNPEYTREDIEKALKEYLNIQKIIWLENGLCGDETDGHVDNIACFAAPGKILLQVCDDPEDENYVITRKCLEVLTGESDAKGRKITVIPIKQPPKMAYNGKRLTLSYLNFYMVNDGIILPVFGGSASQTDELAIRVLQETFPNRKIRTVNGMGIVREGGNVHCTTQQMPAAQTAGKEGL
ncbi:agmatine deiminase family protein [Dehalobacter sp. DCM]|uniref:agmatine deiminase family protein n=1 Tax=Dehalobacter sp. DCM TaxID=2907827 RepID=UPI003081CA8D|nr:agmatine deiminase family protein [Dehalobacter sp. DCM]